MKLWKKIIYALSWIPLLIIKLILAIFGLIWVPVCLGTTNGDFSGMFWLWGNDEEGCPEWWLTRCANGEEGKVAEWFPRFWWYAIRNPVNNFRFLFDDRELAQCHIETNWHVTVPMEAKQLLDAAQPSAYLWIWSGPFAGYRKVWLVDSQRYSEIWFGWKLASKVPGLGFTAQMRLKRNIGE